MNVARRARPLKIHTLELLDDRITPSGGIPVHPAHPIPVHHLVGPVAPMPQAPPVTVASAALPVTAGDPVYAPNGTPMDKLGQTLNIIYQEYIAYEKGGAHGAFVSSQADKVFFKLPAGTTDGGSTQVEVSFQASKGNFDHAVSDMAALGVEVGATDRAHGIITGYIPISQLAGAANDADFASVTPVYRPAHVPFRPR